MGALILLLELAVVFQELSAFKSIDALIAIMHIQHTTEHSDVIHCVAIHPFCQSVNHLLNDAIALQVDSTANLYSGCSCQDALYHTCCIVHAT